MLSDQTILNKFRGCHPCDEGSAASNVATQTRPEFLGGGVGSGVVDDAVAAYFEAWNEGDPEPRRRLLEGSVVADAELVDPTGRWHGIAGIVERIARYHAAAPGTRVVLASGIDAHNDVVRYAWTIVDAEGREVIEGIDVAERTADGRLRRIVMFHGPLPPG